MGKSKRLLEIIKKVKTGHKFIVDQLADEFKVSYRTMLRNFQEMALRFYQRTAYIADIGFYPG